MQYFKLFRQVILLILCSYTSLFAQQKELNYASIPVDWSDFTRVDMPSNNMVIAKIAVEHNQEINYSKLHNNITIELINKMQIDKSKSLVDKDFLKNATQDELLALLNHEKGHFIISVFYHYKLMENIKSYKFTANYKQEIRQIIANVNNERNVMNIKYDKETKHHINKKAQEAWDEVLLKMYNEVVVDEIQYRLKSKINFTI